MVQHPPRRARGHGDGARVGPAVAGIDQAHVAEAEIQHRAGGGADILAHLRADKDEGGLAVGHLRSLRLARLIRFARRYRNQGGTDGL